MTAPKFLKRQISFENIFSLPKSILFVLKSSRILWIIGFRPNPKFNPNYISDSEPKEIFRLDQI